MRRQLLPALVMTLCLTVLVGVMYPLAVSGAAGIFFSHKASGSLVEKNGKVVGSSLLGQNFTDPKYFWPRPSAAGTDGYDGLASAASNLGPSNPKLLDAVKDRVAAYRQANHLAADTAVPVDAVTGSGSGLDPAISVANARLQARRVARSRLLDPDEVLKVVAAHTQTRQWGFLGEDSVNVLELNLALDRPRERLM
ncbi:MAG: potassium-transporting ATPase KdpC subunit [Actinomycetota bacterium]|jgi:K+-transporting ATPase ATPase C chain|nr:potassium-transporting ATPase KdpC subunit [Actinomycetota bacterium]